MSPWQMDMQWIFTLPRCVTYLKKITVSASPQFVGSATQSQTGSWRRASRTSRSLSIWGWKMTTKVRTMRRSIQ